MHIVRKREYLDRLKDIITFISRDSTTRARQFKQQLDSRVEELIYFPYKYRQSLHHNSVDTRDLIYKGYTIVYRINIAKDKIEIIEIFKWTK
jgi:plasmid stabilization system protein ParE